MRKVITKALIGLLFFAHFLFPVINAYASTGAWQQIGGINVKDSSTITFDADTSNYFYRVRMLNSYYNWEYIDTSLNGISARLQSPNLWATLSPVNGINTLTVTGKNLWDPWRGLYVDRALKSTLTEDQLLSGAWEVVAGATDFNTVYFNADPTKYFYRMRASSSPVNGYMQAILDTGEIYTVDGASTLFSFVPVSGSRSFTLEGSWGGPNGIIIDRKLKNELPSVFITSPTNNQTFSEILDPGSFNTLTVAGTVQDTDNDNVTVTCEILNATGTPMPSLTKTQSVSNCSTAKVFTFDYDIAIINELTDGLYTVRVYADDGK